MSEHRPDNGRVMPETSATEGALLSTAETSLKKPLLSTDETALNSSLLFTADTELKGQLLFTAEDVEGAEEAGGNRGTVRSGGIVVGDERMLPGAGIGRRAALKAWATSAVALPLAGMLTPAQGRALPVVDSAVAADGNEEVAPLLDAQGTPLAGPRRTPSDPDLLHPTVTWRMKLTAGELVTLTALCDVIIPADAKSPSASAVGVPAYINEYVSAPAEGYQRALVQVRGGLAWINTESNKRFGKSFARLTMTQKTEICDDICYAPKAKPEFKAAANFFDRVRDLTAEGFYTTDAGMKDIGYVGNVPMAKFDGPPPTVLKHLGLA